MSKRPYKPTKLKLLHGNPGGRKLPENEPMPKPIKPKMPNDLDEGAREAWERLAPMLERIGLLTEIDGDMFAGLCQIRSVLKWISNELTKTDSDEKRLAWLQKEQRLYMKLFRDYAGEFGLTPRGRVGLGVIGSDDESEFAKLLD